MSTEKEDDQAKPLAGETDIHHWIDQEDHHKEPSSAVEYYLAPHRRKCIICCGCCAAILLIPIVIGLVLMFTVFRFKDPVLRMAYVKIEGLNNYSHANTSSSTNTSMHGLNFTVEVVFSVKNPNFSSLKFSNATTSVYYHMHVIGEFTLGDGRLRARKNLRMSVVSNVTEAEISKVGQFENDLLAGVLPISTNTVIKGKVKVMNVLKRRVFVGMNCSLNWNITSGMIQDRTCKMRV